MEYVNDYRIKQTRKLLRETDLPVMNFMHLHSFTLHILLVLYPIVLLAGGEVKPRAADVPKCLGILLAEAVAVYGVNLLLHVAKITAERALLNEGAAQVRGFKSGAEEGGTLVPFVAREHNHEAVSSASAFKSAAIGIGVVAVTGFVGDYHLLHHDFGEFGLDALYKLSAAGEKELLYINKAAIGIFGCETLDEFRELTGFTFPGMIYPEDYAQIADTILRPEVQSEEQLKHLEYRIVRKDGEIRWIDDCGHLENESIGAGGGLFYVFISDITDSITEQQKERLINLNKYYGKQ